MFVDAMRFIQNYQHHGSSTFHELKDKYIKLHLSIILYYITENVFTLLVIDMMCPQNKVFWLRIAKEKVRLAAVR